MSPHALRIPSSTVEIDHTLPFVPERLTHLAHSAVYSTLSAKQKLRYNQLYALQLGELTSLFEREIAGRYPSIAQLNCVTPELRREIQRLVADEGEHIEQNARLNFAAAPELYSNGPNYFVRLPRPFVALGRAGSLTRYFAPALVLFGTLLEERLLHHSNVVVAESHSLEPHFRKDACAHALDEIHHVELNIRLLDAVWRSVGPVQRRANALFARETIRTFLLGPRRAGRRVIERLVVDCPELAPRREELHRALRRLTKEREFLSFLYSEQTNARGFSVMRRFPELRCLETILPGFRFGEGAANVQ